MDKNVVKVIDQMRNNLKCNGIPFPEKTKSELLQEKIDSQDEFIRQLQEQLSQATIQNNTGQTFMINGRPYKIEVANMYNPNNPDAQYDWTNNLYYGTHVFDKSTPVIGNYQQQFDQYPQNGIPLWKLPPYPRREQFSTDWQYSQAMNMYRSTIAVLNSGNEMDAALYPKMYEINGEPTLNPYYRALFEAMEYKRDATENPEKAQSYSALQSLNNAAVMNEAVEAYIEQYHSDRPFTNPFLVYRDGLTGEIFPISDEFAIPRYMCHPSVQDPLNHMGEVFPKVRLESADGKQWDAPSEGLGMMAPVYAEQAYDEYDETFSGSEAYVGPPNTDANKSPELTVKFDNKEFYEGYDCIHGEPSYVFQNYSAFPLYMVDAYGDIKELPPQMPPRGTAAHETCKCSVYFGKVIVRRYIAVRDTNGVLTHPWFDIGSIELCHGPTNENKVKDFQYIRTALNLAIFGDRERAIEFRKNELTAMNFMLRTQFGTYHSNAYNVGMKNYTNENFYVVSDYHAEPTYFPAGLEIDESSKLMGDSKFASRHDLKKGYLKLYNIRYHADENDLLQQQQISTIIPWNGKDRHLSGIVWKNDVKGFYIEKLNIILFPDVKDAERFFDVYDNVSQYREIYLLNHYKEKYIALAKEETEKALNRGFWNKLKGWVKGIILAGVGIAVGLAKDYLKDGIMWIINKFKSTGNKTNGKGKNKVMGLNFSYGGLCA